MILAVGGGSVIDSSKAIGYAVAEPERDVWEIYDGRRTPKDCLPVACVLTIAAAGSEMSNSSVITNEDTGEKRGFRSNLCRPRLAIMNPELTATLPPIRRQRGAPTFSCTPWSATSPREAIWSSPTRSLRG